NRQFIIILTNNPELLRQTRRFQPQIPLDTQRNTTVASNARSNNGATNTNSNHNNREQILDNLFRVELRDAANYFLLLPNYLASMDFDSKDLNTILMNLITKNPTQHDEDTNASNANDVCKVEPMEVSNVTTDEKPTKTSPTTHIAHLQRQQYCLIIFNNPRWSQIVKNKSSNVSKQNDQPQQRFQSTFDWPTQLLVKNEAHDTALDEQFIAKLRQLIYEYMQHTTRPLPLKYFLDLTEE
ncbi:unnamed protein product, partial [Rotaria sp. Silwood1]